jgi:hypothetical protein
MARHCMPQKQTHQIAITALRSAAPASGGLAPSVAAGGGAASRILAACRNRTH